MNQSEFLAFTCNSHKARENRADMVRLFLALLVFDIQTGASIFKPINTSSNRNCVTTFGSHLKTALIRPSKVPFLVSIFNLVTYDFICFFVKNFGSRRGILTFDFPVEVCHLGKSRFQMTVEINFAIAIASLSDWLKSFAPVFQLMRSKTKTNNTANRAVFK